MIICLAEEYLKRSLFLFRPPPKVMRIIMIIFSGFQTALFPEMLNTLRRDTFGQKSVSEVSALRAYCLQIHSDLMPDIYCNRYMSSCTENIHEPLLY